MTLIEKNVKLNETDCVLKLKCFPAKCHKLQCFYHITLESDGVTLATKSVVDESAAEYIFESVPEVVTNEWLLLKDFSTGPTHLAGVE